MHENPVKTRIGYAVCFIGKIAGINDPGDQLLDGTRRLL
jgi:hypothetical protein